MEHVEQVLRGQPVQVEGRGLPSWAEGLGGPRSPRRGYQAFVVLRTGFTVAPVLFGLDKFANLLVGWSVCLAPWIDDILPGIARISMCVVGIGNCSLESVYHVGLARSCDGPLADLRWSGPTGVT
ncbi:hypothetical protein [Streptomyces sp. NPDC000931]|uniref:hypothetical protein n=1 Tax=Streptomyces sp. NPDC000931 TaxID=3154372 RepID=UPI003334248B